MYNRKYMLGYVCLIIILSISMINAVPPFPTEENIAGIQIFETKIGYMPQNTDYDLHLHTSNISDGRQFNNTEVDCNYHLYNKSGSHVLERVLGKGANGVDHELMILGGNLSITGEYTYYIWCNSTEGGGEVKGGFFVTESGVEITKAKSILVIGLMGILFLFVFASLFALFNIENYMAKFIFYWISHILMVIIFFVGWQIGVEGLLKGMAITGIFKILFWISLTAVFPMILLSVAWVVYIHAFNEHFQKLIDKGEDPETAFAITNKKRGWIFGN